MVAIGASVATPLGSARGIAYAPELKPYEMGNAARRGDEGVGLEDVDEDEAAAVA